MSANDHPGWPGRPTPPRGLGGIEVVIIIALVGFLVLCVLVVLPRGRETARLATCQNNLMQLGKATQLYEQGQLHYPTPPPLGSPEAGSSPVAAMLQALTIPDFLDLRDATTPPKPGRAPSRDARVAGLICPSDAQASAGVAITAISYRANAGEDVAGRTGPFAPGVVVGSGAVEAGDGLSFTAGFAERLLGTGVDGQPGAMNYALTTGPVAAPCDLTRPEDRRWRGGAGSSWAEPGWRSTLYNHAVPPNVPTTCVADDGLTATMTASSAHPGRINVWMLDGSLRGVTPTVDPSVWRSMGSSRSAPAAVPAPATPDAGTAR